MSKQAKQVKPDLNEGIASAQIQPGSVRYRMADHPIHYLASIQRQHQHNINRMLRPYGATAQIWRVLAILAEYGECTISHLADMAVLDRTALGRLLKTMEQRDLIHRVTGAEEDKRSTLISLNEPGKALYEQVVPKVLNLLDLLAEGVAPEDYDVLMKVLRRMKSNTRASASGIL